MFFEMVIDGRNIIMVVIFDLETHSNTVNLDPVTAHQTLSLHEKFVKVDWIDI